MTVNRRTRPGFVLVPFLPIVLIMLTLGVGVLIALVAPSRVTSGIYQVVVWKEMAQGQALEQFRIPTESLTCTRNGRDATCTTAPVAGAPIRTTITYSDGPLTIFPSSCVAWRGDRSLPCRTTFGDDGHASHSAYITEWLDISEAEVDRLRKALPWWRSTERLWNTGLLLTGLLGVLAGVASYFLGGRARFAIKLRQGPITLGTGLMAIGAFAVSGAINSPRPWHESYILFLNPLTLIAVGVLCLWQYLLCGDERIRRAPYAVVGAAAGALYSFVALLVLLLTSGFID